MKKEKSFNFINFENSDFEPVDRQKISFNVKGNNDVVLFKRRGTNDYFAYESNQIDCQIKDFCGFCMKTVHPAFYQFKYGDDFFREAKEFHEDMEMLRLEKEWESESFNKDYEFFKERREEEFKQYLGENNLFPAIVIKKDSDRWQQYCDFIEDKLPDRDSEMLKNMLKSQNTAIFCINDDNSISMVKHFTDLKYNILRGKGTIGNLIEITYGSINLLLECGIELGDIGTKITDLKEKENKTELEKYLFANRQASYLKEKKNKTELEKTSFASRQTSYLKEEKNETELQKYLFASRQALGLGALCTFYGDRKNLFDQASYLKEKKNETGLQKYLFASRQALGLKEEGVETKSEKTSFANRQALGLVLISHYHLDHAGLVEEVKCPVYMGKKCLDVLNSQIRYKHGNLLKNVNCFEPNKEFSIKNGGFELKIKPILVDHSAYDSYMFLIKGGDKTLLYTGDFRANGRKSFEKTLNELPDKVDYLICEATNMFSNKKNITEIELENRASELMSQYKHVFVFQAGTNIDRLVSFYKASRKNNKAFLIDTYVAGITENLPNIPNVKTFKDVYCFWDYPKKREEKFTSKYEGDWRVYRKFKRGLGYCEIGSPKNGKKVDLSNFTMLVRPSMWRYLEKINEDKLLRFGTSIFDNSILIYSLWEGYKEKDDVKNFLEKMEKSGVKIVNLHTSGHADKQTIDRLKEKTNPSVIEYIHYILRENNEK